MGQTPLIPPSAPLNAEFPVAARDDFLVSVTSVRRAEFEARQAKARAVYARLHQKHKQSTSLVTIAPTSVVALCSSGSLRSVEFARRAEKLLVRKSSIAWIGRYRRGVAVVLSLEFDKPLWATSLVIDTPTTKTPHDPGDATDLPSISPPSTYSFAIHQIEALRYLTGESVAVLKKPFEVEVQASSSSSSKKTCCFDSMLSARVLTKSVRVEIREIPEEEGEGEERPNRRRRRNSVSVSHWFIGIVHVRLKGLSRDVLTNVEGPAAILSSHIQQFCQRAECETYRRSLDHIVGDTPRKAWDTGSIPDRGQVVRLNVWFETAVRPTAVAIDSVESSERDFLRDGIFVVQKVYAIDAKTSEPILVRGEPYGHIGCGGGKIMHHIAFEKKLLHMLTRKLEFVLQQNPGGPDFRVFIRRIVLYGERKLSGGMALPPIPDPVLAVLSQPSGTPKSESVRFRTERGFPVIWRALMSNDEQDSRQPFEIRVEFECPVFARRVDFESISLRAGYYVILRVLAVDIDHGNQLVEVCKRIVSKNSAIFRSTPSKDSGRSRKSRKKKGRNKEVLGFRIDLDAVVRTRELVFVTKRDPDSRFRAQFRFGNIVLVGSVNVLPKVHAGRMVRRLGLVEQHQQTDATKETHPVPKLLYLIEHIGLLHDLQILISLTEEESVTFRCYRSLLDACSLSEGVSSRDCAIDAEFKPQDRVITIQMRRQMPLRVTEDRFLSVLLGILSLSDLSMMEIVNLAEILALLRLKPVLWAACEWIAQGTIQLESLLKLGDLCFDLLEDEVADDENVQFGSILTLSVVEALQKRTDLLWRRSGTSQAFRSFLERRHLFFYFMEEPESEIDAELRLERRSIRKHPGLQGLPSEFVLRDVRTLLIDHFQSLVESNMLNPNVTLLSDLDTGSVTCHIEMLCLTYSAFAWMLGFEGSEKTRFVEERVIPMEHMSVPALELLIEFAYLGGFRCVLRHTGFPRLLDVVLVLLFAEKFVDDDLKEYCLKSIATQKTFEHEFLDNLALASGYLSNCESRAEIINSWAKQGQYTEDELVSKLEKIEASFPEVETFCGSCGEKRAGAGVFCSRCGKKFGEEDDGPEVRNQAESESGEEEPEPEVPDKGERESEEDDEPEPEVPDQGEREEEEGEVEEEGEAGEQQ